MRILLARNEYGIEADVDSDCAPLWGTVSALLDATDNVHVIRDATRGGVGTVLYEIAEQSGVGIRIDAEAVPVDGAVKGVCGMLGLEPLYLACEGRLVIIAPDDEKDKILEVLCYFLECFAAMNLWLRYYLRTCRLWSRYLAPEVCSADRWLFRSWQILRAV